MNERPDGQQNLGRGIVIRLGIKFLCQSEFFLREIDFLRRDLNSIHLLLKS